MLTPYSKPQFVERIVTSTKGEQFRVVFLVALVNGEMKARVISATSLHNTAVHTTTAVALPAPRPVAEISFDYIPSFSPKISPYFTLDFFTSQPTRAPSRN